jgi:UDP-sugar transporter A1/2/3
MHKSSFLVQVQPKGQIFKLSGGSMASSPSDGSQALLYCILLAFQFGLQPMIANRFTAGDISKTSVVIGTEVGKVIIAFMSIMSEPQTAREKVFADWNLVESIKIAALPAVLYAIQNLFVQHGYVLLDSMTFNLLNQTKVSA